MCGGFTYRGAQIQGGHYQVPRQGALHCSLYQVFFFHFVSGVELEDEGRRQWDWTSYTAERSVSHNFLPLGKSTIKKSSSFYY